MENVITKKRLRAGRVVASLAIALLLAAGLLFLTDLALRTFMRADAMSPFFYACAAVAAVLIFLLLVWPANRPARGLKNVLRVLLLILLPLAVFAGGLAWDLQNRMMYIARPADPDDTAANRNTAQLEEITVRDENGLNYRGWLWKHEPGRAGLIIYFGGNAEYAAGSVRYRADSTDVAKAIDGYNLLMVDYPGYGDSEGQPGEEAIYRMALAVWRDMTARPDVDAQRIVLAGWSLGSGTAARLAAEKKPAGLILMAPFYNGASLVNDFTQAFTHDRFGDGLFRPNSLLLRNKYRSDLYAGDTPLNTLIIGARNDSIIPFYQAEALAKAYKNATFVAVDGSHGDANFGRDALAAIARYLREISPD